MTKPLNIRDLAAAREKKNAEQAQRDFLEADETDYSPRKYYTFSADEHGHSSDRRVKYPPMVAGQIEALIQSGKIPQYKTFAAFARDAAYHRLKFFEQEGIIEESEMLATIGRTEQVRQIQWRVEADRKLIDEFDNAIRAAEVNRDARRLGQLCEELKLAIPHMHDKYKQDAVEMLAKLEGRLL